MAAGLNRTLSIALLALLVFAGLPFLSYEMFPDAWTGPKWVLLFALAGIASLALSGSFTLRLGTLLVLAGLLDLVIVTSLLAGSWPFVWHAQFFQLAALLLLTLFVFPALFPQKFDRLGVRRSFHELALTISAVAWLVIFALAVRLIATEGFDFRKLIATFGYVNMAAEYVVLLLGLLCATPLLRPRWLWTLAVLTAAAFIPITLSRSAWVGLALVFIASLVVHGRHRGRVPTLIALGALIGAIMTVTLVGQRRDEYTSDKQASFRERLSMYVATVDLIAHRPLGIGSAQYEYGASPYLDKQEIFNNRIVFKSPHSEPLRWIAEGGWVFGLVLLLGLWRFWGALKRPRVRRGLPFFAAFAAQALFQFPLEVPGSVLLISLGLAKFLVPSPLASGGGRRLVLASRATVTAIALLVLVYAGVYAYANSLQVRTSTPAMNRACRLDPFNWQVCQSAVRAYDVDRDYTNARSLIEHQLRLRPWDYPILADWAIVEFHSGNLTFSCDLAKRYVAMFPAERERFSYCLWESIDRKTLLEEYEGWIATLVR